MLESRSNKGSYQLSAGGSPIVFLLSQLHAREATDDRNQPGRMPFVKFALLEQFATIDGQIATDCDSLLTNCDSIRQFADKLRQYSTDCGQFAAINDNLPISNPNMPQNETELQSRG